MFLWGNELLITSKSGVTMLWRHFRRDYGIGWVVELYNFYVSFKVLFTFQERRENKGETWTHHLSLPPAPESISLRCILQDPLIYGGSAELTTSGPRLQKRWRIASNPIVQRVGWRCKSSSDLVSELYTGDRTWWYLQESRFLLEQRRPLPSISSSWAHSFWYSHSWELPTEC